MQQKTPADKGLQIASLFLSFSMFPMVLNVLKFGWLMIPPALVMVYFASKKYKEDKQTGIKDSKYRIIIMMMPVAIFIMTLVTIVNYLDLYGFLN